MNESNLTKLTYRQSSRRKSVVHQLKQMLKLLNNEKTDEMKKVFRERCLFNIPKEFLDDGYSIYHEYISQLNKYGVEIVEEALSIADRNFTDFEELNIRVYKELGYPTNIRKSFLNYKKTSLCLSVDENTNIPTIYVNTYSLWELAVDAYVRQLGLINIPEIAVAANTNLMFSDSGVETMLEHKKIFETEVNE